MKTATIYTDGSYFEKEHKGGWAAHIISDDGDQTINGGKQTSDSYEMELIAILHGLQALKEPYQVTLHCDHSGIVESLKTIREARRDRRAFNPLSELPHPEIWIDVIKEICRHDVREKWVKGDNNEAHKAARRGAKAWEI